MLYLSLSIFYLPCFPCFFLSVFLSLCLPPSLPIPLSVQAFALALPKPEATYLSPQQTPRHIPVPKEACVGLPQVLCGTLL